MHSLNSLFPRIMTFFVVFRCKSKTITKQLWHYIVFAIIKTNEKLPHDFEISVSRSAIPVRCNTRDVWQDGVISLHRFLSLRLHFPVGLTSPGQPAMYLLLVNNRIANENYDYSLNSYFDIQTLMLQSRVAEYNYETNWGMVYTTIY